MIFKHVYHKKGLHISPRTVICCLIGLIIIVALPSISVLNATQKEKITESSTIQSSTMNSPKARKTTEINVGENEKRIKENNIENRDKGISYPPNSNRLEIIKTWVAIISTIISLFAILVALYLGDWKVRLRRPNLQLYFEESKDVPYYHDLALGEYSLRIEFRGTEIHLSKPGFNARVKIFNKGKSTAKAVRASIEKICLMSDNSNLTKTIYYHPTTMKWSGESDWSPVDIVPYSHYLLDLFFSINEDPNVILDFNYKNYNGAIDKDLLQDIIREQICPSGEIYWNVWVNNPLQRGIPERYYHQGKIQIHFVVNGENCGPMKCIAEILWTYDLWNSPQIKIIPDKKYINNRLGGSP